MIWVIFSDYVKVNFIGTYFRNTGNNYEEIFSPMLAN